MTTVQITLPDDLAQAAERAGLLSPPALEELLRKQLKAKAASELLSAIQKMQSVETDEDFSPEAMADEVRAMRAERRARQNVA